MITIKLTDNNLILKNNRPKAYKIPKADKIDLNLTKIDLKLTKIHLKLTDII